MKKYVNGKIVEMTEEEVAELKELAETWHWKTANTMYRTIQFIFAIEILLIRFMMILVV